MIQHTYSTKKIILQATILTAISLFFILNQVSAITAIIDAPSVMDSDQEIEVVITVPDQGSYDVKLFFEYNEINLPAEVLTSEGWKNSHYYIQDLQFTERSFNIRLQEQSLASNEISLCLRLRKDTSTSTPTKQCVPIQVNQKSAVSQDEPSSQSESSSSQTASSQVSQENQVQEDISKTNSPAELSPIVYNEIPVSPVLSKPIPETIISDPNQEPIYLAQENAKNTEYTSSGKSKILINYFIALTAIIALFLILRSEHRHREI